MISYHIKGLYKTTCSNTKSNFSQFFFSHWRLHKCFFSFLIKALANFEKLVRFHWQAFIVYKNGENLKTLIEIFYQKRIVSNVILAFLDHLKPKMFFADHGGRHVAPPLFKISWSTPESYKFFKIYQCFVKEREKTLVQQSLRKEKLRKVGLCS